MSQNKPENTGQTAVADARDKSPQTSTQQTPLVIVTAKVMARQAGLRIDDEGGMSTARLQAHTLAGGDVMNVVQAMIAAQRAGIDLDFDRAAAIDLAGRNVLHAVQTSVLPKVINCPEANLQGRKSLSAVAKNGIELRVQARVTVRMDLDQLVGGATCKGGQHRRSIRPYQRTSLLIFAIGIANFALRVYASITGNVFCPTIPI